MTNGRIHRRNFDCEATVINFAMFVASRVFLASAALLLLRSVTSQPVSNDVELLLNKRIVNGNDADPGTHPYIISQQANRRQLYLKDIDLLRKDLADHCSTKPDAAVCTKLNGTLCDLHDLILKIPDQFVHECGGSLIGDVWVLTAAHCVQNYKEKHLPGLRIVLGEHDLSENSSREEERGVQAIIVHPEYNNKSLENDIALIKLSSPVTPSQHIKFAALADDDSEFVNTECLLAGWGRDNSSSNDSPSVLQEIYMNWTSFDDCWIKWKLREIAFKYDHIKKYHSDFIKKHGIKLAWEKFESYYSGDKVNALDSTQQICALDTTPDTVEEPGSSCYGDSGGPMMCGEDHSILTGVASWVQSGCRGAPPNVYTRVSAYTCWIKQHTGIGM